ncbi:probable peptidyl-tRNA hydrolase isoform X2 [Pteropus alecto]|uniref:probable peptidyl-tRNA hydrolase isoform X2 n=1 Tax=Pteropus alecto TaxID=9402 RepID=UPI0007686CAA|nr:probable peptidyl-tRNA hydrolase isoform X2 [Pteropus alecto]
MATPGPALDWTLAAAPGQMAIAIGRGLDDVRGGVGAQNGSSMPPPGLLHAGLWLSRAMSRCVLEPRPPGKRWLVAGLGNPGLPGTRHSVGMAVLGQLARRLGVAESWARDRRCVADLALASLGDAQLVLLRPRRLMNANGRSVARAGATMEFVPALPASTPVSLELPTPQQAMPRLRVGIGRPTHPDAVQAHVLGSFSSAEQELLPPLLERATDLLLDHIRQRSQGPLSGT